MKINKMLITILLLSLILSLGSCNNPLTNGDTTTTNSPNKPLETPEEITTFLTNPGIKPYTRPPMDYSILTKTYLFSSYEEMARAIIEMDDDVKKIHADKIKYEENYGKGYTQLIDSFVEKRAIPVPMLRGTYIASDMDWACPVYMRPVGDWLEVCTISYHLSCFNTDLKDPRLRIRFPSCADIEGIEQVTDFWEISTMLGGGYPIFGEYESCFVQKMDLVLSDRTVSARIKIPKDKDRYMSVEFLYDGMWVILEFWSDAFPCEDFLKDFSIGEYSIAPPVDQTPA